MERLPKYLQAPILAACLVCLCGCFGLVGPGVPQNVVLPASRPPAGPQPTSPPGVGTNLSATTYLLDQVLASQQPGGSHAVPACPVAGPAPASVDSSWIQITDCTEAGVDAVFKPLANAPSSGPVQKIHFSCGGPTTIALTTEKLINAPVIIDGNNEVTLDAQNKDRIFRIIGMGIDVTIQNITLANGQDNRVYCPSMSASAAAAAGCNTAGHMFLGAAINYNDPGAGSPGWAGQYGTLKILHTTFTGNVGRSHGAEDIGGGAVHQKDGVLIISDSNFTGNTGSEGGAVGTTYGAIPIILNTTFKNNQAIGALPGSNTTTDAAIRAQGGAIYVDNPGGKSGGKFILCGSVVDGNVAATENKPNSSTEAGGVFVNMYAGNPQESIFIGNQITGNTSTNQGGGIWNRGRLLLWGNTIDSNSSHWGGAFYQYGDANNVVIGNDTISNNQATSGNGGGGYLEDITQLLVTGTTFYHNHSAWGGGALAFADSDFSRIQLALRDSVFSSNSASSGTENCRLSSSTIATSQCSQAGVKCTGWASTGMDHYVVPAVSGGTITEYPAVNCSADAINQDALLQPLADNGGSSVGSSMDQLGNVKTMALAPTSPALGRATYCPTSDERGIARPSACDAGAYELTN